MNTYDHLADHELHLDGHDLPANLPSPVGLGDVIPEKLKGPGMLEILVSLSILVSLAGVTMPLIGQAVHEARYERALIDMQQILTGLREYSRDTLYLPTGDRGRTNVAWLYGPGVIPSGNVFSDGGSARPLRDVLLNDSMGGVGWSGPYIDDTRADPWGNAYVVNVDGLIDKREVAMVLSAGPNGFVETSPRAARAGGDDILLPVN